MRRVTGMLVTAGLIAAACGTGSVSEESTSTVSTTGASPPITTSAAVGTTAPAPTTSGEHPYGGRAVFATLGLDQPDRSFNPLFPNPIGIHFSMHMAALAPGSIREDPQTLAYVPFVIEEFPSVANGGVTLNADGTMTVRYRIRDEAAWADGVPITGNDFLIGVQIATDEELPLAGWVESHLYAQIIPESVVAGEKTFEYTYSQQTVNYERMFRFIVPAHQLEGSDLVNDWNDAPWVSGGPFTLSDWQWDQGVTMVRNDHFWMTDAETGQRLPYLDEWEVRYYAPEQAEAAIADFAAGEVDALPLPPIPALIAQVETISGAEVVSDPAPFWDQLGFQFGESRLEVNPDSWNEYPEYRQAVAHAIDKERLVGEVYGGRSEPLDSHLTPSSSLLATDAWSQWAYDPERSRTLLAELCDTLARDCEADPPQAALAVAAYEPGPTLAASIAGMLEEVGITVSVDVRDTVPAVLFEPFDLAVWAWFANYPRLAGALSITEEVASQAGVQGRNPYQWGMEGSAGVGPRSERHDEILEQMVVTADERVLASMFGESEQLLADDLVFVPLCRRPSLVAYRADRIGGVHSAWTAQHPELWYRVDGG